MCIQTWAHPKYGDRLDVGLVRQAQDAVESLQVSIFMCAATQRAWSPVSNALLKRLIIARGAVKLS